MMLFLFSAPATAQAQEDVYLIPPVQLLPLKKMQTNSYGLEIPQKTDILNDSLWKNAAFPVIAEKFKKLPAFLPAAAEELRRRLLVLTAEPPAGTADQEFITLRLSLLFERGDFESVVQLAQKIPENQRTDEQNEIYANALLLTDFRQACQTSGKGGESTYQQNLALICAAADKDEDKVYLLTDLIKEQEEAGTYISRAAEALLNDRRPEEIPEETTPLTIAVMRLSGQDISEKAVATDKVWLMKTFAEDETFPVSVRLPQAEELVQAGLMPPVRLRTYYQQVVFPDKKAREEAVADKKRALMIQKAAALSSSAEDNLVKQEYFKTGFSSAKKAGLGYAYAAAARDVLETMTPDMDTLGTSAPLIEAFVLAGLDGKALEWKQKADILFPVSAATAGGWPFAALAVQEKQDRLFIPSLESMMAYEENRPVPDPSFVRKIDYLMLMFDSMGMILPDETWVYTSFEENSPEATFAAREKNGRKNPRAPGEQVLDALAALPDGYRGLLKAEEILASLGLEKEAAAIAAQSVPDVLKASEKK